MTNPNPAAPRTMAGSYEADSFDPLIGHIAAPLTADRLLAEFDGSVCPACHHRAHDPGSCREGCNRCELHTDEAMAFVLRYEPDLVLSASKAAMWREMYLSVAGQWATLLERLDLAEDATADDVLDAARATSTPAGLRERIADTFHDALCTTSHHDRPEVYAATGGPQPCREKYERIARAALQGADR